MEERYESYVRRDAPSSIDERSEPVPVLEDARVRGVFPAILCVSEHFVYMSIRLHAQHLRLARACACV